ncbi:MAG: hypothetical protein F6K54_04065 [Okeania sp. SIO3B5]|uniref:hypothetical protein n=1 Tax=Okeania sp. SIO3B5 TaxID=2607811 RepID=UPI0013FF82ED|nr:hypothetical protein [Okeania sp. SIO3B5]NEO52323.1 hypothetical protein [Okeania sp. SIO3B5]
MPQNLTKNTPEAPKIQKPTKWSQGHHNDDQATTHPQFQPLTVMELEAVCGGIGDDPPPSPAPADPTYPPPAPADATYVYIRPIYLPLP